MNCLLQVILHTPAHFFWIVTAMTVDFNYTEGYSVCISRNKRFPNSTEQQGCDETHATATNGKYMFQKKIISDKVRK